MDPNSLINYILVVIVLGIQLKIKEKNRAESNISTLFSYLKLDLMGLTSC